MCLLRTSEMKWSHFLLTNPKKLGRGDILGMAVERRLLVIKVFPTYFLRMTVSDKRDGQIQSTASGNSLRYHE